MMMSDKDIHAAISAKEIIIDQFEPDCLQPASYDFRVGTWAFSSVLKEKINLSVKGMLVIEPGEFAIVLAREHIQLGKRTAGQIGLRSEFARKGLQLLAGPQIDQTWSGWLKVRLLNLAPDRIVLSYEEPFLTVQFFSLGTSVTKDYDGPSLKEPGITSRDIEELMSKDGMTLGQVMTTLSALANDVSVLGKHSANIDYSIAKLTATQRALSWFVGSAIGFLTIVTAVVTIMIELKKH